MTLKDLIACVQDIGWEAPVGCAGLAAVAAGAVAYLRKRKKGANPLPAAVSALAANLHKPGGAKALRRAWQRFRKRLPADYRRSLVRFQHVLLLGGTTASHARLLNRHAEGLEFMRQLLGDDSLDPELPVAITPEAVAVSLPPHMLDDESGTGREAFSALIKLLYKSAHPVVVVTVDAGWLKDVGADAVSDFVRTVRDRLALLTRLRRRSIEVRVAIDGWETLAGATEAVRLCQSEGMSLHIPAREAPGWASEWSAELAAQMPRALVRLKAEEFRAYVAFCRTAPEVMGRLDRLLAALFADYGAAELITSGGVYLSSDAARGPGPLTSRGEHGRVDPLWAHKVKAASAAAALCAIFSLLYCVHKRDWVAASSALEDFSPSLDTVARETERALRADILAFTERKGSWATRWLPDLFFNHQRKLMRKEFSSAIRTNVLVRGLDKATRAEIIDNESKMSLHWRRSVYFIALIHSDKRDALELRKHMDVVTRMTQLPEGFLREYLDNTDVADLQSFVSHIQFSAGDERDSITIWRKFGMAVEAALTDERINSAELTELQDRARRLSEALPRFKDDELTLTLLRSLPITCRRGDRECERSMTGYLSAVLPKQADQLQGVLTGTSNAMERLLKMVETTTLGEVAPMHLLETFTAKLSALGPARPSGEVIRVMTESGDRLISVERWNRAVHDGAAEELVAAFKARERMPEAVFFSPEDEARLSPVVWEGGAAFPATAVLSAQFTRVAYEECVRRRLESLTAVANRVSLPARASARLVQLIRTAAEAYANRYRSEVAQFVGTFTTHISGQDTLELVLGDMAAARSAFDDFVRQVDDNTTLDASLCIPHQSAGAVDAGTDGGQPADAAAPEDQGNVISAIADLTAEYASWREARQDLDTYKGYAQEALKALTEPAKPAEKGGGKEGSQRPALEGELSPLGLAGLAELREDATAYGRKVRSWTKKVQLSPIQAKPFLEPFDRLARLGEQEVAEVVHRAWNRIRPGIVDAAGKFPFDRSARIAVSPDDLSALFEPKTGLVPEFVHGHLDPLATDSDGPSADVRRRLHIEDEVMQVVRASRELGQRLWDDKGLPRKISLRFKPEPFDASMDAELVPTQVSMQLGSQNVRYFNQMPAVTVAEVDWTVDEMALLNVEFVNPKHRDTPDKAQLLPDAPYWRSLRLLARSKMSKEGGLRPTQRCEWTLQAATARGARKLSARLLLQGDPWVGFNLPTMATAGDAWP